MTGYHTQTNGLDERFTRMMVARLRHDVAESHTDWGHYVQLQMYA